MLMAMEIALGVLLGLLGVALAVLAAYLLARRARPVRPAAPSPSGPGAADDLPGFLESPPGTAAASSAPRTGWAALAPPPPARPTDVRPRGRDSRLALGAMAAVGVLLIALAIALVTGRDDSRQHRHVGGPAHDRPAASAARPSGAADAGALAGESVPLGSDGVAARLTFGGVVLERHAVGVTATYPELEITSDGERSLAHLELPTFHCLTDQAPEEPAAAGCRRSVTEYADLDSPGLDLTASGDRLMFSGDFPTYLRPTGGPPEWTGRVYRIEVSAVSAAGAVEGTLDLGAERAETTPDPRVNVLRRGS
jgi:hypothetical protein